MLKPVVPKPGKPCYLRVRVSSQKAFSPNNSHSLSFNISTGESREENARERPSSLEGDDAEGDNAEGEAQSVADARDSVDNRRCRRVDRRRRQASSATQASAIAGHCEQENWRTEETGVCEKSSCAALRCCSCLSCFLTRFAVDLLCLLLRAAFVSGRTDRQEAMPASGSAKTKTTNLEYDTNECNRGSLRIRKQENGRNR